MIVWLLALSVNAAPNVSSLLAKELRSQIKTRPAPVTLYSYHHRDQAAVDLIKEKIDRTLRAYQRPLESYVTGNGQKSAAVPGFYAALDPAVSAEYGGKQNDWRLIEVRIEKLRYLELSRSTPGDDGNMVEIPFSESAIGALRAAGCAMTSPSLLFLSPPSAACAKIARETLARLKVDALLYAFAKGLETFCPRQPGSAFLFVGTGWLARVRIDDYPSAQTEHLPVLRKILNLATPNPDSRGLIDRRGWPDVAPADEREAREWAKQNLFACGDVKTDDFSPRVNRARTLGDGD